MKKTKMKVIAIHGDYATGEILRRDIGDPVWVDAYVTWNSYPSALKEVFSHKPPYILIGYSRGAEWIRKFIDYKEVIASIGYEPLALSPFQNRHKPKLLITNRWGRHCWTEVGHLSTCRWLSAGAEHLQGRGFHIKSHWGWPPFGHAWDKSLNPLIEKWINEVQVSHSSKN